MQIDNCKLKKDLHAGDAGADDPRVTAAVEEYLAALEENARPNRDTFLARHADVAGPLAECLDALDFLHTAVGGLRINRSGVDSATTTDSASQGVLGDFRIIRELGRGGMGLVYEAEQISLSRRVALKVLPFAAVLDPRNLARFKTEALAAAQLDHPGIVDVYGVGCERGVHYYAMRYIEGRTLAAVIAQARGLATAGTATDAPEALNAAGVPTQALDAVSTAASTGGMTWFRTTAEIGVQVAEALAHAHQHGIVHRDIKPSNLLVDNEGKVRVTDFGLAQVETDATLTLSGDLLGTLRYMSPEQVLGNRAAVDHRTDIYSLGATLYELLALKAAFPESDRKKLLQRIAAEEAPPLRRIDRAVPADLETVVQKAMAREPAYRYATAGEFASDLRRFLEHKPVLARRPNLLERTAKWSRRHRGLVISVFILMLFAIVALTASTIVISDQRDLAEVERRRAEEMAEVLRQRLYASDIRLAWQAWQNADISQTLAVLERQHPSTGQEDLRSFEWHYLWRLCHSERMTLNGHTGEVYSVAYSPNGTRLATASQDGTVKLWDSAGGRELLTLRGHTDEVNGVSFSPDGETIASASDDATVRLWNAATGQQRTVLSGHKGEVYAAIFSPDGQTLATGGADTLLRLWKRDSGQLLAELKGHTDDIEHLAFAPDGRTIATAGGKYPQTPLIVWDVEKRSVVRMLGKNESNMQAVTFSADGRLLASGSEDWIVRLWQTATGEQQATLRGHSNWVHSVAFSPDGRTLVSASRDATVRLWDVEPVRLRSILRGHSGRVWCVAFSPDGRTLATAGADRTVKLWDSNREQAFERLPATVAAYDVLILPGGETVAVLERGEAVSFWSRKSRVPASRYATGPSADASHDSLLASSASGRTLVVRIVGGPITLLDYRDGSTPTAATGDDISAAAFSPDGRLLALGHHGGGLELWDIAEARKIKSLPGHLGGINGLMFSSDGRILISASQDTTVKLWELESGSVRLELRGHGAGIRTLAMSADGNMLATAGDDRTIRIWDLSTGRERSTMLGHTDVVRSLCFSPDGKTIASGSDDQTIRLWHVATGQELFSLIGHTGDITSLTYASDGRSLVSAAVGADGTAEFFVWPPELDTGRGRRAPANQEVIRDR